MNLFSVCIIAKNEETKIEKCLKAASVLPAEIIVTDTGSTDATKEIAAKYADHVYDFTWINDFSAAKNFCISKASHDWILVLDCDEYVESFEVESIENFTKNHLKQVGNITHRNLVGDVYESAITTMPLERFFNRKYYYYDLPIHEQITPIDSVPFSTAPIAITVFHDGYFGTAEEQYVKNVRNASMLSEALKDNPLDAHFNYQMGQTLFSMHEYEKAVEYYNVALQQPLDYSSPMTHSLVIGWINCLNELHRSKEALTILPHYNELCEYADFPLIMGHVYTNLGQYLQATSEYLRAVNTPKCYKEGANSFLPFYHIGNLYYFLGDSNMARLMWQKCGDYSPALQKLTDHF